MNFFLRALSEADGTPSSTRINLLIMLVFTLNLIAAAFFMEARLPEVPESLADLIKFLFATASGKIAVDAVAGAVKSFSGRNDAPAATTEKAE